MSELPEATAPRPGVSAGVWRSAGRRLANLARWCAKPCVRFCGLAWSGAAVGLIVAALFFPAYGGLCMGTGLGTAVDVAGALLLGAVILALATGLVLLGLALARRMPLRFKALVIIAFGSLFAIAEPFGFSPDFALRLGGLLILLPMLAGASIGILRQRRSKRAGIGSCVVAVLMLTAAGVTGVLVIRWLAVPGDDPFLKDIRAATGKQPPALDAPDPSQAGRYEVATLFYGSGTDRHRPEYADQVDLATDPVDASAFLTNLSGFKAWARRQYWGFEPKNFPLNARVWYPQGEGPFPLVLIVHGNHKMEDFSDPGYAYLGELLASRGFISGLHRRELPQRQLGGRHRRREQRPRLAAPEAPATVADLERAGGQPLPHKVDLSNIALMGHSRGGEAIVHAAAFNRLRTTRTTPRCRSISASPSRRSSRLPPSTASTSPWACPPRSTTSTTSSCRAAMTATSISSPAPARTGGSNSPTAITG